VDMAGETDPNLWCSASLHVPGSVAYTQWGMAGGPAIIVPAKASRGQLPLVSSQTRERVPHSSMQTTAQCKWWYSYASIAFSPILFN
jgi:hypothetical protein